MTTEEKYRDLKERVISAAEALTGAAPAALREGWELLESMAESQANLLTCFVLVSQKDEAKEGRLTPAELAICKAIGAKWISVDDRDLARDFVHLWKFEPKLYGKTYLAGKDNGVDSGGAAADAGGDGRMDHLPGGGAGRLQSAGRERKLGAPLRGRADKQRRDRQ